MSSASYCVLLNSDTEVTDGWLDKLIAYMNIDDAIGIVGPLSNTASWQSVPQIFEHGEWASNPLVDGMTVEEMARLVTAGAYRQGISLGFLNGFCLLIRREMLDQIGSFDEETFGAGYGEENDLCIRARQHGWRLVVADDVYIFHHQSRSYTNERRRTLSARADQALARKHSHSEQILPFVHVCRDSLLLHRTRLRIAGNRDRAALVARGRLRYQTRQNRLCAPGRGPGRRGQRYYPRDSRNETLRR